MKRLTKVFALKCMSSSRAGGPAPPFLLSCWPLSVGWPKMTKCMSSRPSAAVDGILPYFSQFVYRLSTIKFLRHYFGQDFPVPQAMRTILTKDTPAMVDGRHSQGCVFEIEMPGPLTSPPWLLLSMVSSRVSILEILWRFL